MASQTVKGSGSTVNNGATVLKAGNIDSSNTVTQALGMTTLGYHSGIGDNRPVASATANIGTTTTKGSGTFAYTMVSGQFIGKRLTTQINGVSNTTLRSGGGYKGTRSAIHYSEQYYALGVNSWNYVTGAITKGGTAGSGVSLIDPATAGGATAAADSAARPTRAVPGELVVTNHSMAKSGSLAVALQANYPAKTD
jgi:hypothetical protein